MNIRGENAYVTVTVGGETAHVFDDCVKINLKPNLEVQDLEYLGRTTSRKEEVYSGSQVTAQFHVNRSHALQVQDLIRQRARRQVIGLVINLFLTVEYPDDGEMDTIMVPDLQFSDFSFDFGDRKSQATLDIDAQVEDIKLL